MPMAKLNNGVEMYYEVHGEENEDTFVLINGLKSDHTGWMPMLEKLKERFRVILLDNRAIGQTKDGGKAFKIECLAEDVIQLMSHLDIDSAHVAGHSMGGAIAQTIAHRYPEKVKTVFLCNTFMKFNEDSRQGFGEVLKLYQQNATPSQIMDVVIPWVFVDTLDTPEFRKQIYAFVEADPLWQKGEDYKRQLDALNDFDSTKWVGEISVPTIVVGSNADKTALPQESHDLAHCIPGAKLEMLEGGHASAVEQADAFTEILFNHTCTACMCTK